MPIPFGKILQKRFLGWEAEIEFIKNQYKIFVKTDLTLKKLLCPQLFSEKMQWRKLFDSSKILKEFSDRVAVQSFIRRKGFGDMLVPQLWVGTSSEAIPFNEIPRSFVLKSTHASGQVIIVHKDQYYDRNQVVQQASSWLQVCYGTMQRERGYIDVPRRLVIEPLLTCGDGSPPLELKIFVFNGIARVFQYNAIDKNRNYKIGYLDQNWKLYQWNTTLVSVPEKPRCLDWVVHVAEKLCIDIDHCRVDFYISDNKIYIGEMTPYSWSGMVTLNPPHTDIILGSFWKMKFPTVRALVTMAFSDWGAN